MIIKNGLVVDPALGLSEKMDLAIENGTILKIEKNIDTVVFDRGGYIYHGVVKELAEAAREGGLKF